MRALCQQLRDHPRFQAALDDETINDLFKSAPLHDIGKVGIPDQILLKPGKLTPEEFEIVKTHTTLGRDTIAAAELLLDAPSSFLRHARKSLTATRKNGTAAATRKAWPAATSRFRPG